MQTLPANVVTQIGQDHKPVLLVEITLPATTVRYCTGKANIVFPHGGAATYTARALDFGGYKADPTSQVGRMDLKIDNTDKALAALGDLYDWTDAPITIKRIFLNALGQAPAVGTEYKGVFTGLVDSVSGVDRHWLTVTASAGRPLSVKTLQRRITKTCQWRFGGAECNADGLSDLTDVLVVPQKKTGTATGGTTTTLIDTVNLTQADDHWNFGFVQVTISGRVYTRNVTDFDNATKTATLDVALPVAVPVGAAFTIYRGCDKTYATCSGSNAWGPSANNSDNFGGFLHVGQPSQTKKFTTQTAITVQDIYNSPGGYGLWGQNLLNVREEVSSATTSLETIEDGPWLPVGYGLVTIPGLPVRSSLPNAASVRAIFALCEGEIESVLSFYVNGQPFAALADYTAHVKGFLEGSDSQAATGLFSVDDQPYRNTALMHFTFSALDNSVGDNPKAGAFARAHECTPIGGGADAWTNNPAEVLYDFLLNVEGRAAGDLNDDAFNSLAEYCAEIPTSGTGTLTPPAGVGLETVRSTSVFNRHYQAWRALDLSKLDEGANTGQAWYSASGSTTNQCVTVDLGHAVLLTHFSIVNAHASGANTNAGVKAFKVQGSNAVSAMANVNHADNTGWTDVETGLSATAYNAITNPLETFQVTAPATAYRCYRFVFDDNHGSATYMGLRRLRLYAKHPRFTFDRLWAGQTALVDAKKELCNSFFGAIVPDQGKLKPVWNADVMPDGSGSLTAKTVSHAFDLDNIVKGQFSWSQPRRINQAVISYEDMASGKKASVIANDDAHQQTHGIMTIEENCPWVRNQDQALRRARRKLDASRLEDYEVKLKGWPDCSGLEPYDLVTVTHTLTGWTAKQFYVLSKSEDIWGLCDLVLKAYHAGVYGDQKGEEQPGYLSTLPNPTEYPGQVTNLVLTQTNYLDESGHWTPTINVTYDPPDIPNYWKARIFLNIDSAGWEYFAEDYSAGAGFAIDGKRAGFVATQDVDVKVLAVNRYGVQALDDVTAPEDTETVALPDLEAEIAALPASGGRIVLPKGTYQIAATIDYCPDYLEIVGVDRDGVIIEGPVDANSFEYFSVIVFRNLTFKTRTATTSFIAVFVPAISGTAEFLAEDCIFQGKLSSGATLDSFLGDSYKKLEINRCKIQDFYYGVIVNGDELFINNCLFINNYLSLSCYITNILSVKNNLFTNSGTPPQMIIIGTTSLTSGDITGNEIISTTYQPLRLNYFSGKVVANKITITMSSNDIVRAISASNSSKATISNNIIDITQAGGTTNYIRAIELESSNDCIINNNRITFDYSGSEATLYKTGITLINSDRNALKGNSIDATNNGALDIGIVADANSDYNHVDANTYYRVGTTALNFGSNNTFANGKDI